MGLFAWLRASVKRAIVEGVQDAVAELSSSPSKVEPATLQLTYQSEVEDEKPVRKSKG